MAKKANKKSPEEIAFQSLLEKAHKAIDASEKREQSKKALQVGKELAMLLRWLQEMCGDSALTEEIAEIHLAQTLKEYPQELKKALAYYNALKKITARGNLEGFTISGESVKKGRLWLAPNWHYMELPKEADKVEAAE